MTLDPNSVIRKQDGYSVVGSVTRTPEGRDLAWKWIQTHWDQIITVYDVSSQSTAGSFVSYCVTSFNKPEQLMEAEEFYQSNLATLKAAKTKVEIAIQRAKVRVEWMEQHYEEVANWLEEQLSQY